MMRFLRENLSYKILALALSIGLFANVKLHQEPFTTAMTLPIHVRDVPETLIANPSISQVTVVLYGPKVYVSRLAPDDLSAYVNLRDAEAGHTTEDVTVEVPANLKPLVRIQAITPDRTDVRLHIKRRKSVRVSVVWEGEPVAGARYGEARIDPKTVDVAGAEAMVQAVDHAIVRLQAGDPHITGRFPVIPVDADGDPVSEVRVWPDAATLDVTLTQTSDRRQAFVAPSYNGEPAPGFAIDRIWTTPDVVTVLGPPEAIGRLNSISTETVEIEGARADVAQTVAIQTPRGVIAVPDTVQVRIRLRATQAAEP